MQVTKQTSKSVQRLLEVNNPAEVDNNLIASLAKLTKNPIEKRIKTLYGVHGYDEIVLGYDIHVESVEECKACIEMVELSLSRMSSDEIKNQLDMLSAMVVKPAGESKEGYETRRRAISIQLSNYPADIVQCAIKSVAETTTFFPPYADFYKNIEWRLTTRNKLLQTLTKKLVDLTAQEQ